MSNSNEKSKVYIPDGQGSLGLLALGDIGLKLWREAKEREKNSKDSQGKNNSENTGEEKNA